MTTCDILQNYDSNYQFRRYPDVRYVNYCMYRTNSWRSIREICPIRADCKGARGDVKITLFGKDRIADFTTRVNRNQIMQSMGTGKAVCYGLEGRPTSTTSPEYLISDDPYDPVYYSSCYSRQKQITFITPDWVETPPTLTWRYESKCLDCASYNHISANQSAFYVPNWVTSDVCTNCDLENGYVSWAYDYSYSNETSSAAASDALDSKMLAVIAVVGLVAFLCLVGGAMLLYSRIFPPKKALHQSQAFTMYDAYGDKVELAPKDRNPTKGETF